MDLAGLALLVGMANGLVLLVRPVGRLHSRIDRLEFRVDDLKEDVDRILGASGFTRKKSDT